MKINLISNNYLGKLSIILIIIMPLFFYIGMLFIDFYKSTPSSETILQDIKLRPGIALSMLAGFFSGITAFFTSIISIIRKKDYCIFVFLSSIIGFFVLIWFLIELIFVH